MDALIKGAIGRVEIPCPDQRTMMHIQMRLNMLRGAMFREHHEHATLVMRARITRTWDKNDKNKNCVLVLYPHDSQFSEIFKRAGIEVKQAENDILNGIGGTSESGAPPDTADAPSIDPYEKWKKLI
jgi:hypothetical protein